MLNAELMQKSNHRIYSAGFYARLSKDDFHNASNRGKSPKSKFAESNSIKSQKELGNYYANSRSDIQIVREYEDDGYTGLNFERPGFLAMLEDIRNGVINCVIVKDYSRLGRDHIETGKYIKKIFPRLGIRFIAINEEYDSANEMRPTDHILMPFKNLMNDNYSRDGSTKVRSHLEVKQRNGELTAAFAVYGYQKEQGENGNHLVVDEYAASVVSDMFWMVLQGYSLLGIAENLNQHGILSPLEYKRYMGSRYQSGFKVNVKAQWDATVVRRIVTNEVYIGVLEQGKVEKLNYKIEERIYKPKEEWRRVENAHAAVIEKRIFWIVQELLQKDMRRSPKQSYLYPFSGLLLCGDCGEMMIRKTEKHNGTTYAYYVCSANKKDKTRCSSHRINEDKLKLTVGEYLSEYIQILKDIKSIIPGIKKNIVIEKGIEKIQEHLTIIEKDKRDKTRLQVTLYEDYKKGFLDLADYKEMSKLCKTQIESADIQKGQLEDEIAELQKKATLDYDWIDTILNVGSESVLDRVYLVLSIKHIEVYSNRHLNIEMRYRDEFEELWNDLEQQPSNKKIVAAHCLAEEN